jgi:hypothetical protein
MTYNTCGISWKTEWISSPEKWFYATLLLLKICLKFCFCWKWIVSDETGISFHLFKFPLFIQATNVSHALTWLLTSLSSVWRATRKPSIVRHGGVSPAPERHPTPQLRLLQLLLAAAATDGHPYLIRTDRLSSRSSQFESWCICGGWINIWYHYTISTGTAAGRLFSICRPIVLLPKTAKSCQPVLILLPLPAVSAEVLRLQAYEHIWHGYYDVV